MEVMLVIFQWQLYKEEWNNHPNMHLKHLGAKGELIL